MLAWGSYGDGQQTLLSPILQNDNAILIAVGPNGCLTSIWPSVSPGDKRLFVLPNGGLISIIFNDTNNITIEGTTDGYTVREIMRAENKWTSHQ